MIDISLCLERNRGVGVYEIERLLFPLYIALCMPLWYYVKMFNVTYLCYESSDHHQTNSFDFHQFIGIL